MWKFDSYPRIGPGALFFRTFRIVERKKGYLK